MTSRYYKTVFITVDCHIYIDLIIVMCKDSGVVIQTRYMKARHENCISCATELNTIKKSSFVDE